MDNSSSKVASVSSPLPEDDTDDNVGSPLPADVNVATFECRGVVSDDDETECRICRGGAEMGPLVCPLFCVVLADGRMPCPDVCSRQVLRVLQTYCMCGTCNQTKLTNCMHVNTPTLIPMHN